jgi:hypothetical protein
MISATIVVALILSSDINWVTIVFRHELLVMSAVGAENEKTILRRLLVDCQTQSYSTLNSYNTMAAVYQTK